MHTKLFIAICILLALCACEFPVIETIGCDVTELIDAINDANATPATGDTIGLAEDCIYELTVVDNSDNLGNNGLPVITSPILIIGNNATIQRSIASGTPQFRLFKVAVAGELLIQNTTLSNGYASPADNTGSLFGGAISNQGEVSVSNSTFLDNQADSGGAIRNFHGTVNITNSTFSSNVAHHGGAVVNAHGELIVTDSEFNDNVASIGRGGAIYNAGQNQLSKTEITGSTFTGNYAYTGGAVDNRQNGFMNVFESSFFSNGAARGGAFYNTDSLHIFRTTIANNTAHYSGGGIQNLGYLTFVNSTLSGNSLISVTSSLDDQGSAIFNDSGGGNEFIIIFSTITANSGSIDRPALYIKSGLSAKIYDSIIAMNTGGDCGFSASAPAITTISDNLDSDGSCTGFTITADPLLGPLADNGGPTLTHALLPRSPAIDLITGGCYPQDQRWVTRPQGNACDLGAYEFEYFSPIAEPTVITTLPPLLPTATPSPTEEPTSFHLDMNGFCRRGPDKRYKDVTAFTAETMLDVDGRNAESTWWWIGEFNCWISDAVGEFHGNAVSLPVIIPPPLPEPPLPEPEPELACSEDLNQELCIKAGGTWVENVSTASFCSCPED